MQTLVRELPGPRGPAAFQTLLCMRSSLPQLERYAQRYGDIFRMEALVPRRRTDATTRPLVSATIVIVSAPEDLRTAFTASGEVLTAGDAREFVSWMLGRESVVVLDGQEHRSERHLLLSLLTPDRLAAYQEGMREAVARALRDLPASGSLALAPLLDEIVLQIAVRLLFGFPDPGEVARARRFLRESIGASRWTALPILIPALQRDLGRWSPGGRAAVLFRDFRALVTDAVERRGRSDRDPDTLLGDLLAHEEGPPSPAGRERRFFRVVTILAGHDTVAVALTWCFYHLLQDRTAFVRACEEARTSSPRTVFGGRRDGCSSYLEAVCREALRMHPPVPVAVRRAQAAVDVGGFVLEPGTYLVPAIHLAHRRPQVFPEPGRFRPDRFRERSYSPWEFTPFGGGSRGCLGHALALRQMVLILSELLREFDFRSRGSFTPGVRRRAVMLLPRDPLRVDFRRVGSTGSATRPC